MFWSRKFLMADEPQAEAPKANGEQQQTFTVENVDNHVYFYATVNGDRCLALMKKLRELDNNLRNEAGSRGVEPPPIWLHMRSFGGDLFTAFALADQIPLIKTPIHAIAEGVVASAATIIYLACGKRYILPNSFLLIHEFSSFMWGKHEEFKDEMRLQEMLMELLIDYYEQRTGQGRDELGELLKHDYWMNAAEAIERAFAQELLGSV